MTVVPWGGWLQLSPPMHAFYLGHDPGLKALGFALARGFGNHPIVFTSQSCASRFGTRRL